MTESTTHVDLIDLDADGQLLYPGSRTVVPREAIPGFLETHLRLREDTTDIFLHVHGWRTSPTDAEDKAHRLFGLVDLMRAQQAHAYPRIRGFRPQYVGVRWPSADKRLPLDYYAVRDRTEAMSESGQVARVLGAVLGYFNTHRELPESGPDVLASAYGQYLHCVGHSFGSRFLLHGILEATSRLAQGGPNTLAWNWPDPSYPWTLDSLTLFQAALPADSFAHPPYAGVLAPSVLNAPVVMTYSPSDTALGFYHRRSEKQDGIGHRGATAPAEHIARMPLQDIGTAYKFTRDKRLINVDASHLYVKGMHIAGGAHSDFYHPESAHLLLSLADAAR
ncbi:hypothetical protein [Streptomyces massasporeus]|uniref:hypothetical protein n=1 Tax=Streptomyces massasporeus TaxID=67324 RepID=UPI001674B617|nr:hypothetical protein [Streptomyces massasporeus]GGV90664.1 hypothetical protein GCM10010228_79490 [Streptomyces massasporeus]